jgi:hypothetical protein
MSSCKYCGEDIEWRKDGGKNIPVNADGSFHRNTCKGNTSAKPVAGGTIGLLAGYTSGSATFRIKSGATKTYALHQETFKAWQAAGYGPDQWNEFSVNDKGFIQHGARNVSQPDWGDKLKDPTGGEIKTPNTNNPAPCTTEQPKETPCTSPQAAQPAPVSKKLDRDLLISMVNNPDTYWRAKALMDVEAHEEIRQQVVFKNWTEAINSAITYHQRCEDGLSTEEDLKIVFSTATAIHDFIKSKAGGVSVMQSHKCAHLDACGDQCRGEEWCQYKLMKVRNPDGPIFCGKDQLIAIRAAEPQETYFDGSEITIGGA